MRPVPCSALSEPSYLSRIELDELLHEGLVAPDVLLLGEVRGQHEVEVPGGGVAGHPGRKPCSLSSAWMSRADSAIRSGGTQTSSMISEVPGGRKRPIRPWQPLAHGPGDLDPLGVASEVRWADQLVLARGSPRRRPRARRAHRRSRRRTRPAAPPEVGGSSSQSWGAPAMFCAADHQGRSDHQLDRGRPGFHQRRHRLRRRLDAVEVEPGDGGPRRQRNGLEDRLGDEGERALGADQEAPEDLAQARPRPGRHRAGSRSCS